MWIVGSRSFNLWEMQTFDGIDSISHCFLILLWFVKQQDFGNRLWSVYKDCVRLCLSLLLSTLQFKFLMVQNICMHVVLFCEVYLKHWEDVVPAEHCQTMHGFSSYISTNQKGEGKKQWWLKVFQCFQSWLDVSFSHSCEYKNHNGHGLFARQVMIS